MATGGEALIDFLAAEGIRHIFTVPGESFIAVLDAMHDDGPVRPVTCRNESGAAMMAEATGKLTGRPGVALVTRGPGAANAVAGVYVAYQDATPMVLCVGLPPRSMDGLPAFQTIDLDGLFGKISKLVVTVPSAERLDATLSRAFRVALSGRRGPVVIGLPEDVLEEAVPSAQHAPLEITPVSIDVSALDKIRHALAYAERPIVIAGGSEWSSDATRALEVFADRFDLPVVTSFRRQDHIDNRHRCYVGHAGFAMDPSLAAGLKASDVVIVLGADLGEVTTQRFALLSGHPPEQQLIYIGADAESAECTALATLSVTASTALATSALAALPLPGKRPPWSIWRRDLRGAYEASIKPRATPGNVKLESVIAILSDALPADAIVTNGAGNYAAFLHRYFTYKAYPTQLAPLSGSMGYGLPAAIAAKLVHPARTVIALAGDGCLQMTSQELMTAVQFGLPIVVIIANNGILGTIRMHQERRFPGRVTATSLMAPDFVSWAQSCGANAERVETTAEFAPALRRALDAARPAVIELALDSEAISPTETISSIRAFASKKNTP
jgi:acetolactate synthase-1/2/3 large subunit